MNIAIGADHRGFALKAHIKQYVTGIDDPIAWIDVGAENEERSDFPAYTIKVCELIKQQKAQLGILACGSGVGMSIAANRYNHIYAALAWNDESARLSKEHNNANILVLPADFINQQQAVQMVNAWLAATFQGGRYQARIDMIDAIKV